MSNIAILSANGELARFFELELLSWEHNVSVISSASEATGYDILFVDIDTVHNFMAADDRPTVSISAAFDKSSLEEPYTLSWPADIRDIRKLCIDIGGGEQMTAMTRRDGDAQDRIYVTDRKNFTVSLSNTYIKLSKNEFSILEELCAADGKTVKRERIMEILGAESGNISDVYICHLRRKLEMSTGKRLIITERGAGYKTFLKML